MSIGVPHTITKDWRTLAAEDAAVNRRIQLKNIARDTVENAPRWKAEQMKLYGDMLEVSQTKDLATVIGEENGLAKDNENNRAVAIQLLRTVSANPDVADYIVDRLEPDEILYLVTYFKGIVREITKTRSRFDKDDFIKTIKAQALENPVPISEETPELSARGREQQLFQMAQDDAGKDLFNEREQRYLEDLDMQNQRTEEETDSRKRSERQRNAARFLPVVQELQSAYEGIDEDLEREAIFRDARIRKQAAADALLSNENSAPPTRVGFGSNDYANPSTPLNVAPGGRRQISPAETPEKSRRRDTFSPEEKEYTPLKKTPKKKTKKSKEQKERERLEINMTGRGVLYGRGANIRQATAQKRHYFGKYYIELPKLANNILSAKYSTTDAYLPSLKVQHISSSVKELIQDVMADKYDQRIFNVLSTDDKRTFKRFVKALHLDHIPIQDDLDAQFQKEYEILLGEFNSGNDSPEVKKSLKRYVVEGLNEGKLNRHQAYFLLYQLSL